ncbi:MAG: hypothetical protein Q4D76_16720 [Oscillospiraceae bacterium]|nr:hypothetical protein [Oscillospiraceae bacterium]
MDYDEYIEECKKIKKENKILLDIFADYLKEQKLSDKTIKKHYENVDFYLNDYMLYEDAHPMQDGVCMIGDYLGYFFIRKCMWSTPGTIKSTAASIKKFYKCMLMAGKIEKDYYQNLCDEIKEGLPEWMDDCAEYNDPDGDDPFFF